MREIEARPFIFPEGRLTLELTPDEVEKMLRARIERIAEAAKSWWKKGNLTSEQLGGVDYIHPEKTPDDVGITIPDFPTILEGLMKEYGASSGRFSRKVIDLSRIRGMEDYQHVTGFRIYPTKIPGLVFEKIAQFDKKRGEITHIWWHARAVVPGTIVTEEEMKEMGKRQIRLKTHEGPATAIEVTGFWWNYEGLARISGIAAKRLLDEFSQVDDGDKKLLVAGFEEEITHKHEYPCELTINQETGLAVWFDETLLNFAIFQDSQTGELLLHKPKFERPKVIKPPIEIENFPYLSIVGGSGAETERIDDIIRNIARTTTGFERRRFSNHRGVLEFDPEPFHQGRGPIELEIPIISQKST